MIRDGGSLTMTYEAEDGRRYILALWIALPAATAADITRLQSAASYGPPVVIDPVSRPPDSGGRHYSELSGEASPVSWLEASELMSHIAGLPHDLDGVRLTWFINLQEVVSRQGRPLLPLE